jgi:hypothetical protein
VNPEGFLYYGHVLLDGGQARELRTAQYNLSSTPHIHRSLKPLGEVDFLSDVDRGQLLLWNDVCTGMCGV